MAMSEVDVQRQSTKPTIFVWLTADAATTIVRLSIKAVERAVERINDFITIIRGVWIVS